MSSDFRRGGKPTNRSTCDQELTHKIAEVTRGLAYGRGWLPVIDYGVRVNIEPLKTAGVLPTAADRMA